MSKKFKYISHRSKKGKAIKTPDELMQSMGMKTKEQLYKWMARTLFGDFFRHANFVSSLEEVESIGRHMENQIAAAVPVPPNSAQMLDSARLVILAWKQFMREHIEDNEGE